jgi:2',3'-cyclic-nucleotide 2'-phosphodiesterase (5'-nucleotidase family)
MVRRAETNLGDFIADAIRIQTGADIGIIGGGAIRTNLDKGDVSYGTILTVFPFQNQIAVIRLTGDISTCYNLSCILVPLCTE